MRTYEESLKIYRDNYSVLETARKEGHKEGVDEGKQEERFEIARRLKKKGVAIEIIVETTELTKEQIEQL